MSIILTFFFQATTSKYERRSAAPGPRLVNQEPCRSRRHAEEDGKAMQDRDPADGHQEFNNKYVYMVFRIVIQLFIGILHLLTWICPQEESQNSKPQSLIQIPDYRRRCLNSLLRVHTLLKTTISDKLCKKNSLLIWEK